MGLTQSTPEESIAHDILDNSARTVSPPHPSRSDLNPATPSRTGISYFLPISTPELQHSHLAPTPEYIQEVSEILATKLPPELVVRVIDEAKYWAGCRTLIQKDLVVIAGAPTPRGPPTRWRSGQEREKDLKGLEDGRDGEVWYLASEPIGCDQTSLASKTYPKRGSSSMKDRESLEKDGAPMEGEERSSDDEEGSKCWLRGMVIETLSKDQGWSSAVTANPKLYGTYDHSYSWFEMSLLRDGKEVEKTRRSFQNNIHAGQYFKAHRHVFGPEDEFVKQAKSGDRVIIWARAQYPGWRNLVREAAITLYTAPFPPQT